MKNKTRKTTKALKAEIAKLEQAYKTIATDCEPAMKIDALGLILKTYKQTKRRLAQELRTMIRRTVKFTAAGTATAEHRELIDLWRTNVIEVAAKIEALESGLYLYQQWSKAKPA